MQQEVARALRSGFERAPGFVQRVRPKPLRLAMFRQSARGQAEVEPRAPRWAVAMIEAAALCWDRISAAEDLGGCRDKAIEALQDPALTKTLIDASQGVPRWLVRLAGHLAPHDALLARLWYLPFSDQIDQSLRLSTMRVSAWMARAVLEFDRRPEVAPVRPDERPGHLLDYYDDWTIPREVRQVLFRFDISCMCTTALCGAALKGVQPPDWMPSAVYSEFTDAARPWLDLMANVYAIDVPEPLRERFDWTEVQQRHVEWREARAKSVALFEQGGRELRRVLPPSERSGRAD